MNDMGPEVKSYLLVLGDNPSDLALKVNDWIDHGYYPVGGPTIYHTPKGEGLIQAVISPDLRH